MALPFRSLLRPHWLGLLATLWLAPSAFAVRYIDQKTYDDFLETTLHNDSHFAISNVWILLCAALVFAMHLGFTTLEVGLNRQKNTVNILYKNVWIICAGLVLYALMGYRTMYPGTDFNGVFRFGFGIGVDASDYYDLMTPLFAERTWWTDFIFKAMYSATAITIVSGAVTERMKLPAFMVLTVPLLAVGYPVAGSWAWQEGGWLQTKDFYDFAGGSVVHAFGGFTALAVVLQLGPRLGKYTAEGIKPIVGHSMPMAVIGTFLLWFGWMGFNGGSVIKGAHPEMISLVVTNTVLAGACGGLAGMLVTQILVRKPDISIVINGVLAGLVAVTAGADAMLPYGAMASGAIGGAIVIGSIVLLDRIKIDDPLGAISVHGVGGLWSTLAVGFFGKGNLLWQAIGGLSYAIAAFAFTSLVILIIRLVIGIRVKPEEEIQGLDLAEHGQSAYNTEG